MNKRWTWTSVVLLGLALMSYPQTPDPIAFEDYRASLMVRKR